MRTNVPFWHMQRAVCWHRYTNACARAGHNEVNCGSVFPRSALFYAAISKFSIDSRRILPLLRAHRMYRPLPLAITLLAFQIWLRVFNKAVKIYWRCHFDFIWLLLEFSFFLSLSISRVLSFCVLLCLFGLVVPTINPIRDLNFMCWLYLLRRAARGGGGEGRGRRSGRGGGGWRNLVRISDEIFIEGLSRGWWMKLASSIPPPNESFLK